MTHPAPLRAHGASALACLLVLAALPLGCIRMSLQGEPRPQDGGPTADSPRDVAARDRLATDGPLPAVDVARPDVDSVAPIVPRPLRGERDPSFGDQGTLLLLRGSDADVRTFDVAIDAEERLYLQGRRYTGGGRSSFLTARLLVDGSLDESFGSYGYVLEELSIYSYGYGLVLRPTGGLLLIGDHSGGATRQDDILVMALLPNGFRDLAWGSSGAVAVDLGNTEDTARRGALDSAGRLVVCGTGGYDLASSSLALVRLSSTGQVDTSFGTGGVVRVDGGGGAHCGDLVVLADDSLVAVGQATPSGNTAASGLFVHLDAAGASLLPSAVSHRMIDDARGLSLQRVQRDSDGSLLVAATLGAAPHTMAVLRLDADGAPNVGFGQGGMAEVDLGGDDRARALSVGPDGRIVVAGVSNRDGSDDFAFVRLAANGTLDASFGNGGKLLVDFAGQVDSLEDVARLRDGRLVAVGWSDSGTRQTPALTRLR